MQARITVIGPGDLTERILDIHKMHKNRFPNLSLTACPYEHESEAPELVTRNLPRTDVFLFTGPVPYYRVKDEVKLDLVTDYISVSTISFIQAVYEYRNRPDSEGKPLRFSVDSLSRDSVTELLEDLNIGDYEAYVREYNGIVTTQELTDFHSGLQLEEKTDFAVTYLASAYEALRSGGFCAYRTKITNTAIRESLTRLNLEAGSIVSREAQICSGVMKIKNEAGASRSAYENRRLLLSAIDAFITFCESLNASFRIDNENELTFVTTRGIMEKMSDGHKRMPLLARLERQVPMDFAIGIGYGRFANEAEKNARSALMHAENQGRSSCYYVMDDGYTAGVFGGGNTYDFSDSSYDGRWIEYAKDCGVSVMTLSKIAGIAASRSRQGFTANDIAEWMNITLRSARRLMRGLVSGGAARVVGEQQPIGRGRPRQIFEIII